MLQSELSIKGNQELEPFRLLILYKKKELELVKHATLQENLVLQLYSLDQEICGASLDLKIKNQCTL